MRRLVPPTHAHPHSMGFSLIEVLVAMTILSVAGVALIETAQHHADRLERLEAGFLADTVAANHLVGLRLSAQDADGTETVIMGDRSWRVQTRVSPTSHPELAQVSIEVFSADGTEALTLLTGFIDTRRAP